MTRQVRDEPVFLVGFMSAGKTAVARLVAAELGWNLIDLDEAIAREAAMSIPDIFAAEGERGFREREARAVHAASAQRRAVIATGGGAACREESLRQMLRAGRVVWLAVTAEEAVRRSAAAPGGLLSRPMLAGQADPVAAAAALLEARRPFYARAHRRVDTVARAPEEIARDVLGWLAVDHEVIGVELGARRYDVHIGSFSPEAVAELLAGALGAPTGVALLVDGALRARAPRVAELETALRARLPAVTVKRRDLPAGEAAKNLAEIERTTEWLAAEGFDRGAAVVGVGGGATGDASGFTAAIYLRGIRFALVPTTLLAMVDASVGGKTGVDLAAGKNLVGAFHQPRVVVADLGFLGTLPARERTAGLAEVAKCGFIADPELLDILERSPEAVPYLEVVARAVRVKAEVVASDEREGGRRAILNFGHTVGHALEAASKYSMLHGEAVSLGMIAALEFGAARGLTPLALVERGRALLARLGLPVNLEDHLDAAALASVNVDKKRRGATIKFVFCTAAGETRLVEVTPEEIVRHFLERARTADGRA
jgi:3-dehydroquinate synthase